MRASSRKSPAFISALSALPAFQNMRPAVYAHVRQRSMILELQTL